MQTVPDGYHAVTPWIIGRDTAGLLDFVKDAFGAEELARVFDDSGAIGHAEFRIGDSVVMAFDSRPGWPETPGFLRLFVPDADAALERAVAAGGRKVTEVTPLAWGDRVGRVRDPLRNLWWIQSRVEEVDPDEMTRRWGDPTWAKRMAYVQASLNEEMAKPGSSHPMRTPPANLPTG
jgi:PhnB protein